MTIAVRFDAVSRHFGTVRAEDSVNSQMRHGNALVTITICSDHQEKNWCYHNKTDGVYDNCVFAEPVPSRCLTVFAPSHSVQSAANFEHANQNGKADGDTNNADHKIANSHSTDLVQVAALAFNHPKNQNCAKNAGTPLDSTLIELRPTIGHHFASERANSEYNKYPKICQYLFPPNHLPHSQSPQHQTSMFCWEHGVEQKPKEQLTIEIGPIERFGAISQFEENVVPFQLAALRDIMGDAQ